MNTEPVTIMGLIGRMFERGVTYRRYGLNGELKRAMIHRWDYRKIRGSIPLRHEWMENIVMHNALLDHLLRQPKPPSEK